MFQKIVCITTRVGMVAGALLLSSELIAKQIDLNPTREAAWAAGFFNEKTRDDFLTTPRFPGLPGYRLSTGGGIMGLEWQVCPCSKNWQWGIAYRYDSTDLDTNQPVDSHPGFDQNFDSTRAIIYTRIDFCKPVYLTGMLSVAFNQYNIYQNVGELPYPAVFGAYDGWQWSTQVELGYKLRYCGFTITPELSLQYSNLKLDRYDLVSADVSNNQLITPISGQNDNALFTGFDLNIAYTNQFPKAQVNPYIHAAINYQTIENSLQSFTAGNVLGGGSAFIYLDSPAARTSYQVGAGIEVLGDKNVTVVMRYDYTARSDENDHTVLLSIKHDW